MHDAVQLVRFFAQQ